MMMTHDELLLLENLSLSKISQIENLLETTDDIKWLANEISEFNNSEITEFYIKNEYGRNTRWNTWNEIIDVFKTNNIRSCLDIGCANGHFVYLCLKKDINSYGLEPRKILVDQSNKIFESEFTEKKIFTSTYGLFIEYLISNNINLKFDCISAINFSHGKGHDREELILFFENIFKFCEYILISEPTWSDYNLENLLLDHEIIQEKIGTQAIHKLIKKK